MTKTNDLEKLILDPRWRFADLIPQRGKALFVLSSREDIDQYNFVDHRYISGEPVQSREVDLKSLMNFPLFKKRQPVHFIWHTAFCGSTLVARSLGIENIGLSIREPNVLMQLSMFKRNNAGFCLNSPYWNSLLALAIQLLAKPFCSNEVAIIKPSNTMNNLASDIMKLPGYSKHLMLYSKEKDFLISNLKKGRDYQLFCDTLLNLFSMDSKKNAELIQKWHPQEGLKKAALVWQLQIKHFINLINENTPAMEQRMASCYFKNLLAQPEKSLKKIYDFFNLNISENDFQVKAINQVMFKHSKYEGESYNSDIKQKEDHIAEIQSKQEINDAMNWCDTAEFCFDLNVLSRLSLFE